MNCAARRLDPIMGAKEPRPMNELRLLFHPTADNEYRVQLQHSTGGDTQGSQPFTPFLEDKDYEDLRWYLEDFLDLPDGGAVHRAARIEGQLQHWGRQPYYAVFAAPAYQEFLQRALPTLALLEELLREAEHAHDPYAIVHFDGHGTFIKEIQLGGLCFERGDDGSGEAKPDLVRADQLGALVAAHRIPLVVLEACRS